MQITRSAVWAFFLLLTVHVEHGSLATASQPCDGRLSAKASWVGGWNGNVSLPVESPIKSWTVEFEFTGPLTSFEQWTGITQTLSSTRYSVNMNNVPTLLPGSKIVFEILYRYNERGTEILPSIMSIKLNGQEMCELEDDQVKTSNENETVTFDLPERGSTYLGFLASKEDSSFTFEVAGLVFMEQGAENSTTKSYQSFEAQRWHLMQFFINKKSSRLTATIYPNTMYTIGGDLGQPRKIKIKSKEKIYWTQCKDYHSCYFSGLVLNATDFRRDSPTNSTTLVLVTVCGLLIVTVIGLLVLILIQGKKSTECKEPELNMTEEAI
ncbi:uncharacterized protein [Macrobrachium rosenbergii]|uniref:uncharacterized protein n=1 Tax=Macrobrachium rosenbergii TaxID=79674 RepID=UPI0034D6C2C4